MTHHVIGDLVNCHLHKRYSNPISYLLLPDDFLVSQLPTRLAEELVRPKRSFREKESEDSDGKRKILLCRVTSCHVMSCYNIQCDALSSILVCTAVIPHLKYVLHPSFQPFSPNIHILNF